MMMMPEDDVLDDLDLDEVTEITPPKKYKVILLNDDYTPMEFVVAVLVNIFGKQMTEAVDIMMQVHQLGQGVAGIYRLEIAKQKLDETIQISRANQHPLSGRIEEE